MLKNNSIKRSITLFIVTMILVGCSVPGITGSSEDTSANEISAARTDAAKTVVAQFTNAATQVSQVAQVPSVTQTMIPSSVVASVTPTIRLVNQPTTILLPELTLPASATPKKTVRTATATKTRTKTSATTAEPTQKIIYKWKPTKTKTPYIDVGKLITQSPPDWQKYAPGQDFDVRWNIRNVGGRDWNKEFYFIYEGGTLEPEKVTMMMMPYNIAMGDEIELLLDMVAPLEPGNYVMNWAIVNDDAIDFFHFFLAIKVVASN